MQGTTKRCLTILAAIGLVLLIGCDEDHRIAEVAVQSAERQAAQNEAVTALNHEVAEGTKRLAQAQAAAREELVAMQRDVQIQRNELEAERRALAEERHRESLLAPVVHTLGLLFVGSLPLVLCWYLLHCLKGDSQDQAVAEVLTFELTADEPLLLPPPSTPSGGADKLPGPCNALPGPPAG
jgi:multidrug efflux pump subunit AcrA (membrane-fusion protein)